MWLKSLDQYDYEKLRSFVQKLAIEQKKLSQHETTWVQYVNSLTRYERVMENAQKEKDGISYSNGESNSPLPHWSYEKSEKKKQLETYYKRYLSEVIELKSYIDSHFTHLVSTLEEIKNGCQSMAEKINLSTEDSNEVKTEALEKLNNILEASEDIKYAANQFTQLFDMKFAMINAWQADNNANTLAYKIVTRLMTATPDFSRFFGEITLPNMQVLSLEPAPVKHAYSSLEQNQNTDRFSNMHGSRLKVSSLNYEPQAVYYLHHFYGENSLLEVQSYQ